MSNSSPSEQKPWEYFLKAQEKVSQALAQRDILFSPQEVYAGAGVAQIFGTPAEVTHLRLGRKHCEGHQDFSFRIGSGFQDLGRSDYSIFLPITIQNVDRIVAGHPFEYSVADIREDPEGHAREILAQSLRRESGNLPALVALMPKKKILGAGSVDVRIGNSTTPQVTSTNRDDQGNVLIYSLKELSSVLYNPDGEEAPRPHVHWGSNGWKEPLEVSVKGDRLFFDERQQPGGQLWMLEFQAGGYNPIAL